MKISSYEASRIAEQHAFLPPAAIDYISLRMANKTFTLVAVLHEDGMPTYRQGETEVHPRNFDSATQARAFCKRFYKGIAVQRD